MQSYIPAVHNPPMHDFPRTAKSVVTKMENKNMADIREIKLTTLT